MDHDNDMILNHSDNAQECGFIPMSLVRRSWSRGIRLDRQTLSEVLTFASTEPASCPRSPGDLECSSNFVQMENCSREALPKTKGKSAFPSSPNQKKRLTMSRMSMLGATLSLCLSSLDNSITVIVWGTNHFTCEFIKQFQTGIISPKMRWWSWQLVQNLVRVQHYKGCLNNVKKKNRRFGPEGRP